MRKMKKALAAILTATMVLSMGMTAWATPDETIPTETEADPNPSDENEDETTTTGPSITVKGEKYDDMTSVTIPKIYQLLNAGTTSPEETFTVRQTNARVVDGDATSAPNLGTITGARFDKGAATVEGTSKDITIQLPDYDTVGIYEYTLQEIVGTTAGVDYRTADIKLVVTVMQGDDGKVRVAGVHAETDKEDETGKSIKISSIVNTYKAAGGEDEENDIHAGLRITKTVEGNMADHEKYFDFTLTLEGENGKKYDSPYTIKTISTGTNKAYNQTPVNVVAGSKTTVDLKLKHGDTVIVENLPYGVKYMVTEKGVGTDNKTTDGYTVNQKSFTSKIGAATHNADFVNTKIGDVDTGVILDSMPYMALLAVVAMGMGAVVLRKREKDLF